MLLLFCAPARSPDGRERSATSPHQERCCGAGHSAAAPAKSAVACTRATSFYESAYSCTLIFQICSSPHEITNFCVFKGDPSKTWEGGTLAPANVARTQATARCHFSEVARMQATAQFQKKTVLASVSRIPKNRTVLWRKREHRFPQTRQGIASGDLRGPPGGPGGVLPGKWRRFLGSGAIIGNWSLKMSLFPRFWRHRPEQFVALPW